MRILRQRGCMLFGYFIKKIGIDVYAIANFQFTAKLIPNRKKENGNAAAAGVDLPTRGPRVVHTSSEVDFVDDGYRWRKYGQKLVRGNTNPRYIFSF